MNNCVVELTLALNSMSSFMTDNHGNLSYRYFDGTRDVVAIKPSGASFGEINAYDIPVVKLADGKCIHDDWMLKPSVDLKQHLGIYRSDPSIVAVCHTHTKYAVVMATVSNEIKCYTTEHADRFGGQIEVCNCFNPEDMWPDMRGLDAVLLDSHGAVVVSRKSPAHAAELARSLEDICERAYLIEQTGWRHPMAEDKVMRWNTRYNTSYGQ